MILGPGASLLTISGNDDVGVLQVDGGTTATASGQTISGGSDDNGGGVDNGGTLSITDSAIVNNGANNDDPR